MTGEPGDVPSAPGAVLPEEVCLVVVLGDFGREAALRFCATLARLERQRLQRGAAPDTEFYDEQRRMQLVIQGQLAFVKEPFLRSLRNSGRALHSGLLVGFEGGLTPDQVEARLGVLALEAMAGPLQRGVREVLVLLPCNTLAPVSWALQQRFGTPQGLAAMLEQAGAEAGGTEARGLNLAGGAARIRFPTVPEAVLLEARRSGRDRILPLGTLGIIDIYRRAASRLGMDLAVLEPSGQERAVVLRAIEAAIGGEPEPRARAELALQEVVSRHMSGAAGELLAVEACTDLDYGVGLDSCAAYARHVVDLVYGQAT